MLPLNLYVIINSLRLLLFFNATDIGRLCRRTGRKKHGMLFAV